MTEPIKKTEAMINALRRQTFAAGGGKAPSMRELFAADKNRFAAFSRRLDDLLLDFSKTTLSHDALAQLQNIAQAAGVFAKRDAMFAGEKINRSEDRAVLHTALRANPADSGGGGRHSSSTAAAAVRAAGESRAAFLAFAEGCRRGDICAADGAPYTDVVNLGIGGSDLGPAMACAALAPFGGAPFNGPLRVHFVSNMDGAHLDDTLQPLQAARTLVIISSKTFTTLETMTNATRARAWLTEGLNAAGTGAANKQLAAVTAAPARAQAFGAAHIFAYQDWVGGRTSLWGAAGLPIALAIGRDNFNNFLRGAADMDAHFCSAPAQDNLPLLFALAGIWHRNICGYPTRAILPYDQRLHLLPAYLQQLEMESNGKRARPDGGEVSLATVPVVWGSAGTNAQHAYFQMLHQGTDIVPSEFIAAAKPTAANAAQHKQLIANCLAQTAALMQGDTSAADAQRQFPGERPSITIFYKQLTPHALGRLIALYEHRTFAEGVIWGINSYDQWGVELGKRMAQQVLPLLEEGGGDSNDSDAKRRSGPDASTQGLLEYYRQQTS